jgi:hypothetical protein
MLDIVRRLNALERAQSRLPEVPNWPLAVARGGTGVIAIPSFLANKNGTGQTGLPSAAYTKVTFTNEVYDTNSNYDTTNSRFTPTVAGKYLVHGVIQWVITADQADFYIAFFKNGGAAGEHMIRASGAGTLNCLGMGIISMNGSTDYVECYGGHNAGGNRDLAGTPSAAYFGAIWVGP